METDLFVPSEPEDVAECIKNNTATGPMFDRMVDKFGFDEASAIWRAGCLLFDSWELPA